MSRLDGSSLMSLCSVSQDLEQTRQCKSDGTSSSSHDQESGCYTCLNTIIVPSNMSINIRVGGSKLFVLIMFTHPITMTLKKSPYL